MKNLYIKGLVTKTAENKYRVIASTDAIDRQGDVIDQNGWELDNYMKNPVMLFAHDYSSLPVAKCIKLSIESQGLVCDFEFAPAEGNPVGAQIKYLYDNGFMNAVSVGFIPKEQNGGVITKAELLEISLVPVPANQEALRLAYKSIEDSTNLSVEDKTTLKTVIEKGEVANELNAEEMIEAKFEKWDEVIEVISALWSVYFQETTPVEDFSKLLLEAVDLLTTVADNDGMDDDEVAEGEKGIVATAKTIESKGKFISAISEKAGREISSANHEKIKSAHEFTSKALAVLEELKTSAQGGDEKSIIEEKVAVNEPKKEVGMTEEELKSVQATLRISKQNSELALKAINDFLSKKKSVIIS